MFPAPEPVDIPDHLTPEKTLEIFTDLVNGMETALHEMLNHAKSEGITNANKAMEEFQHLYLEHVEQLTGTLMKTHGITQEVCLCYVVSLECARTCEIAVQDADGSDIVSTLCCRFSPPLCKKLSKKTTNSASKWKPSTQSKPRRKNPLFFPFLLWDAALTHLGVLEFL